VTQVRRPAAAIAAAVVAALGSPLAVAPGASAATREFWVVARPVAWNAVPNGRVAITGAVQDPSDTVLPTTVYQRYSRGWRRPLRNTPAVSGNADGIPGPLLRAREGDTLRVHFLNRDPNAPHSMHFHGVAYAPSSDGAYLPGVSGRDADVRPGQRWTYVLRARRTSVGAWPYHDHSPSMDASIAGGMYGMLSIIGRRAHWPDREFVVALSSMRGFMTINGRAFLGNTPVFRARVGQRVQWDVMALGSEHHTFHVHGHRWRAPDGTPRDTQTVGPAESFRIRWQEDAPGTWLYHCHVEQHMMAGMIGTYRVTR
jgi:FtsP/CotA-like multicopper oxidase with cupredoxin domain